MTDPDQNPTRPLPSGHEVPAACGGCDRGVIYALPPGRTYPVSDVFLCTCPLGRARPENWPIWTAYHEMNFRRVAGPIAEGTVS